MRLPKYFNKISVKVALVVTVLMIGLFVLLNFLVIDRGEQVFSDVYGIIIQHGSVPPQDTPFVGPPISSLPFFGPTPGQALTPREHFRTRFEASLIIIGLIAIFGAAGIGFLTFRTIRKPLNKLSAGMKKLHASHYTMRLEENDSEEFNTVIHEFNALAAELQRVEELRKNLISDTSHELKTPLASLTAQLEGIEDGVLTIDKERVKLLKEQVERLRELVDGLQDYARLRSQTTKLDTKNFKLKDLLNKLTEQRQTGLSEKKITVQLNIPDDYALTADPALLERVFANLLENAIRYSQAKQITITADQTQIIFSDDGVGIPAQHLQDIFERFFRLEKSRSRATGGMGLGLSIVREIVEAHGWKISARIPQNSKGVEFVIEIK